MAEPGNPPPPTPLWLQFRRDQVTAVVRKVYLNAIALKPNIKISADTITWGADGVSNLSQWYSSSSAWNSVLQDWRGWMEEGILDLNIPMNYYRVHQYPAAYTNWMNFAKDHKYNRHLAIGPGIYLNYTTNAIIQMRGTREASPNGNYAEGQCGYVYKQPDNQGTSFGTFKGYLTSSPNVADPLSPALFSTKVPIPVMPWKSSPTNGHLKGTVYGVNTSTNLDGAVVTLTGPVTRSQTNDATGFYGFVDLPPGNYTVSASFSGYVATNSSVTISAGAVATRDLLLALNAGPPVISANPQSQTVYSGTIATFAVTASGPGTLSYQWRHTGTNLAGATTSTLTIDPVTSEDAGPYVAVVSNPQGSVTSAVATLTVIVPQPNTRTVPLWNLAPGSRFYLTSGATERGLTFNPVSNRLLLAGRSPTGIYVLSADDGSDLHSLNLGSGIIVGGTYTINLVSAADDGAIYVCNLATDTSTSNLRIYRWANDNPTTAPTVAYSGNPFSFAQRMGDTLDVRGSGTGTQILLATRSGTNVVIFTTSNGTTFTPSIIAVGNVPGGAFGLGVSHGAGNTFWGKASGTALRQVAYNLGTGTGVVTHEYPAPGVVNTVSAIGVSTNLNVVAGVSIETPDNLQLYDLPSTGGIQLVETNAFPADNPNSNGTGAVDFGGDRVFALDTGNGILALRILPPPTAPSITSQPASLTVLENDDAVFSVSAAGTAPLAYQWFFNNAPSAAPMPPITPG